MKPRSNTSHTTDSLVVKVGASFEASATGSGVLALVVVFALLTAAEITRWFVM